MMAKLPGVRARDETNGDKTKWLSLLSLKIDLNILLALYVMFCFCAKMVILQQT